jgi:SAM-dependent methyltransferase
MAIYQPERVLLRKQILELAPKFPGDILDVGGADGSRYRNFFSGSKYISLDIDPELLPDVVASADSIPFPDETFDTILSSQMLEHVTDPVACMNEIARVMKSNAILILTVPQQNELHSEPHDYWRFTKFGAIKLCEDSGLQVIQVVQRGGFFSCIGQSIIRLLIDTYNPFENGLSMRILSPISRIVCFLSIKLDERFTSIQMKKHALGWSVLAKKL